MNVATAFKTVSRRGLRVVLFTSLLVAFACDCSDDNAISACLAEVTNRGCIVHAQPGCTVIVSYLPPGSSSTGCSGNPAVVTGNFIMTVNYGTTCVEGCEKICSYSTPGCASPRPSPVGEPARGVGR